MRRVTVICALMVVGRRMSVLAQGTPPTRPPLFLSESWKALSTPPDDHGAWPASQQGVSSPNLQLRCTARPAKRFSWSLSAAARTCIRSTCGPARRRRRARRRFAIETTSSISRTRWRRSAGLSGPPDFTRCGPSSSSLMARGSSATARPGPSADFNETDISIADLQWMKLDIERVVAVGNWIDHVRSEQGR